MNDREVAMVGVSQNILRAFVREALITLSEEAVAPSLAVARGLALMTPSGRYGTFVLYDTAATRATLVDMSGETARDMSRALMDVGAIKGYLEVSHAVVGGEKARVVSSSASEHGFGPLLYDAALLGGPLTSSRTSVSLSAERVWRYYYERRSDVSHRPIGGKRQDHVKSRPWLNQVYELSSGSGAIQALIERHAALLDALRSAFGGTGDIVAALSGAGNRFFDDRYVEA